MSNRRVPDELLIRELNRALEGTRERTATQQRRIARLERERRLAGAEVEAVYASTSWRLTHPARQIAGLVKFLLRRTYWITRRWVGRAVRVARRIARRSRGRSLRGRVRVGLSREDLEREYTDGGLDRLPDRFVVYRIIGNDLVPRHKKGQSRENVEFILDHEPELQGCEKRWVINRIVDSEEEAAVIALLEARHQQFIHLPFEWSEYCRTDWDLESYPFHGYCLSDEFDRLPPERQQRALVYAYRHKNNYAMNNNGARNFALREGRSLAKWVLPWDGNCFLTQEAWQEIRDAVTAAPYMKYFVVPMARVGDNRYLADRDFRPNAREEPQLIFRSDTQEEFNPELPYGRRPKVELLWRLGVRGPWEEWGDELWDLPFRESSSDAGAFSQAGWVVRLGSGVVQLEESTRAANRSRTRARDEAIIRGLERLDGECLSRHRARDPDGPLIYRRAVLDAYRHHVAESDVAAVALANLEHRAVFAHEASGPFGDERREPSNGRSSRVQQRRTFDSTLVLALAAYFTEREDLAKGAVLKVRDVLDRSSITMAGTSAHPEEEVESSILRFEGICHFLDAVRILDHLGALGEDDEQLLRIRVGERLNVLAQGSEGVQMARATGPTSATYDLEVAAMAAYVDDYDTLAATLRRSHERLLGHFSPDGPGRLLPPDDPHAMCLDLVRWVSLADLFAGFGQQLWRLTGDDGRGLEAGIRCFMDGTADLVARIAGDVDGVAPLSRRLYLALAYADYYGVDEKTLARWEITGGGDQERAIGPRLDLDAELPQFWYLCRASALFGFRSIPTPPALGAMQPTEGVPA